MQRLPEISASYGRRSVVAGRLPSRWKQQGEQRGEQRKHGDEGESGHETGEHRYCSVENGDQWLDEIRG